MVQQQYKNDKSELLHELGKFTVAELVLENPSISF